MFKEEYARLEIFKGLQADQLQMLDRVLECCHFLKGQTIFEQGETASRLFILASGEVSVRFKPYDGPALIVARIQPGGVFGWSAALRRDAYTSGAVADMESDALALGGLTLHRFCEYNPEIGSVLLDRLAGVIAERLSNTHTEVLAILTQGMDLSADCWRRLKING